MKTIEEIEALGWIAGIDFSITSPAVCLFDVFAEEIHFDDCVFYCFSKTQPFTKIRNIRILPYPSYKTEEERFDKLTKKIMTKLNGAKMVALEGYSFGSKGRVFNIGEATGLLKHKLYKSDTDFITVAPTEVKKLATGKGNANKETMLQAFIDECGIDLKEELQPKRKLGSPTTDIIDSFFICQYLWRELTKDLDRATI